MCQKNVRQIENQQKTKLADANARFEEKKNQIIGAMTREKEGSVKKANDLFKIEMGREFDEFKARHHIVTGFFGKSSSFIYPEFEKKWNEIIGNMPEGEPDEGEALKQMQVFVTEQFNTLLNAVTTETNCEVDSFWETRTSSFKRILSTIIMDNPKLNDEQKAILDGIVANMENMTKEFVEFDLREHNGIKMGLFSFIPIGRENYNNSGCCRSFLSEFDKLVKERIQKIREHNGTEFETWCGRIIDAVSEKISTFNDELHEAELEIAELQKDIDLKNQQNNLLRKTIDYIENILCMQRPEAKKDQ